MSPLTMSLFPADLHEGRLSIISLTSSRLIDSDRNMETLPIIGEVWTEHLFLYLDWSISSFSIFKLIISCSRLSFYAIVLDFIRF